MIPTRLGVSRRAHPIHGERVLRTRFRAARWSPPLLVMPAVLLGACSAESPDSGSATAGSPKSSTPAEADEPSDGVFDPVDPDEPTLPGGVKVLSQDVDGFAPVDSGPYAVRVSESLLYQFDLPAYSDVHSGLYLNPGRRSDGDSIVWLTPANKRTALPVHPCRDHDPTAVGPTVGDLASALNCQPYLTTTKPVAVTVGGADGLVGRDGSPLTYGQGLQHDTVTRTETSRAVHGQRTEDLDAHRSTVLPPPGGVNGADTRRIPRLGPSDTGPLDRRVVGHRVRPRSLERTRP